MKGCVIALVAMLVFFPALGLPGDAIGVAPADKEIMFEPYAEKTVTLKVFNTGGEKAEARISVEGELADCVELQQDTVHFESGETEKKVSYTVRLPEGMEEPGDHVTRVIIKQVPREYESEGGGISIVPSVGHLLKVHVPYPGKYAKARMFVPKFRLNEENNFAIEITNLGEETIDAAVYLDIYGPGGEEIATLTSDGVRVESKDKEIVIIKWTPTYRGEFLVKVRVKYSDLFARDEKYVTVGELLVDVEYINVDRFFLGDIAKFNIMLRSEWNSRIEGIYAQMVINDAMNRTIGDVKTPTVDMEPFEREVLNAYWDTEGVDTGVYDAGINIHYGGKVTERKLRTYVTLEDIETEIIGITARVLSPGGEKVSGEDSTPLLISILLVSNLGWIWYFRRRKKGGGK